MNHVLKEILTLGIPKIVELIKDTRDDRLRKKIKELERTIIELNELLEYRQFVEKQRLKQNDAAHVRGKYENRRTTK